MAETGRSELSKRLRRLPGQLLLALVNATAVLVIGAAVLALVAMMRIEHFAGNVAATMTEAVLSKVELPQRNVLANLQTLTTEVRALRSALADLRAGENAPLAAEVARLREVLANLNTSLERLRHARSLLTDEAVEQLGRTVTDALVRLKGCPPERATVLPRQSPELRAAMLSTVIPAERPRP
jgi:hypothetical protein